MNNKIALGILSLLAVFPSCSKKENPLPPFKQATVLEIGDPRFNAVNAGESKRFKLNVDGDFEILVENGDWLKAEASEDSLYISIVGPLSDEEDRSAIVTLKSGQLEESVKVNLKKALALGWTFEENYGTGGNLAVFENEDFAYQTAVLTHEAGSIPLSGYGRFDFSSDASFKKKINDGFSIETVFSADELPGPGSEMCLLGCCSEGGFKIGVSGSDSMNRIFVQAQFGGKLISLSSPHSIKPASYYHLVYTWNPADMMARLYLNNELVDSCEVGSFSFPAASPAQWICIGGNSSKTGPVCGWNGELIKANFLDAVLDAQEVSRRFAALPVEAQTRCSGLRKLAFIPQIAVSANSSLNLVAEGLKVSDRLELYDIASAAVLSTDCSIDSDRAMITLPSGLKDGSYRLDYYGSSSRLIPLGVVEIRTCDPSCVSRKPKVIAHRGVHNTGAPENSIAAFRLAQQAGYYASETDIWLSSDDSLMVNHDGKIGGYSVQTTPYSTLRGVTLGNGEKLPSLSEYLQQARQSSATKLIIEVKDHSSSERTLAAARAAVEMVHRMGLRDRVEYIAFSYDACLLIRSLDSQAVIGYLNGDRTPEDLLEDKIDIMDYSVSVLLSSKPDYVDRGHKIGIGTNIWTVNDRATMLSCIARCADYITTDYPETVKEIADKLF